jgi:hypothetical protein
LALLKSGSLWSRPLVSDMWILSSISSAPTRYVTWANLGLPGFQFLLIFFFILLGFELRALHALPLEPLHQPFYVRYFQDRVS